MFTHSPIHLGVWGQCSGDFVAVGVDGVPVAVVVAVDLVADFFESVVATTQWLSVAGYGRSVGFPSL